MSVYQQGCVIKATSMQLPTRRSLRWLLPCCLIVLAANLWIFFSRNWEDSLYPTDYATLYYPLDTPTLREWQVEGPNQLRLDLAWNKTPESWQLFSDGKLVQTLPGNTPRLDLTGRQFDGSTSAPLADFKHHYQLRPLPAGLGPDLNFSVTAISADYYRKNGMRWPKDIYLVQTTLPAGNFLRRPLSYWTDDYHYIGAANLAAADRVVREQMGITDQDATLTRIEKVMRYLSLKLAGSGGVPKDDFRWMDPWNICQEMINGTGKGWCTQNAQIYTFFANRAGIPTRFVFGANTQADVIIYNGHSWAESWVKEQNRWTYVDLTQSLYGIADKQGTLLNTADILHLCEHDAFDGITARIFKDWHWKNLAVAAEPLQPVTVPYSLVNWLARQEYGRQAIIKYRHPPNIEDVRGIYSMLSHDRTFAWTNFTRYLYDPPAAYSMLPTDGVRVYRLRQTLFAGLILSLIMTLIALSRRAPPRSS